MTDLSLSLAQSAAMALNRTLQALAASHPHDDTDHPPEADAMPGSGYLDDDAAEERLGWCECCDRVFTPEGFRPGDRRVCPRCQVHLPEFADDRLPEPEEG